MLILQFGFVSAATSPVTQHSESVFSGAGTSFCTLSLCKQSKSPRFCSFFETGIIELSHVARTKQTLPSSWLPGSLTAALLCEHRVNDGVCAQGREGCGCNHWDDLKFPLLSFKFFFIFFACF